MHRQSLAKTIMGLTLCCPPLRAAPTIASVATSAASVGTYAKEELTVSLGSAYANPFDSTQIDLSAVFTAPSGKTWKVNGFWDGSKWRVRFAAAEIGNWSYAVTAIDPTGTVTSPSGTFAVTASSNHGWVKIAPNKRYLAYDDGTTFFGIGACHAWGPSTATLAAMQNLGMNTFVYWNGTYDGSGGGKLIESSTSGLGKYDQDKCVRIDSLLNWSEQRGLTMILVVWAHDYLCNSSGSCPSGWPSAWASNPYGTIVTAADFMSDAASWSYQQKSYRYMIARWGYSRALQGWQTIDEIGGTDGWVASQSAANTWAAKVSSYFQKGDPFKHPTNGSQGGYWTQGNAAHDLANTENYNKYDAASVATIVQQLWRNNTKPAIMGESGTGDVQGSLWSGVANGLAITPLLWQFQSSGDGWTTAMSNAYPPLAAFLKGIDFSNLESPAEIAPTVSGASAWGVTSRTATFGYVTGAFTGKSLSLTGLANDTYDVEWWGASTTGKLANSTVAVTAGTASLPIPATTQSGVGFKLVSNATTGVKSRRPKDQASLTGAAGTVRLSSSLDRDGVLELRDARGKILARMEWPARTAQATLPGSVKGLVVARLRAEGLDVSGSFLLD